VDIKYLIDFLLDTDLIVSQFSYSVLVYLAFLSDLIYSIREDIDDIIEILLISNTRETHLRGELLYKKRYISIIPLYDSGDTLINKKNERESKEE